MNRSERRKYERNIKKSKNEQKENMNDIMALIAHDKEQRESGKIYIHAVYADDEIGDKGPIKCHTHNMENFGLPNMSMTVPSKKFVEFARTVFYDIAACMLNGEVFDLDQGHIIDEYENGPVKHGFWLVESNEEDDYTGKKNLQIQYYFGLPVVSYDNKLYEFSESRIKWTCKGIATDDELPQYIYNDFSGVWIAMDELVWLSFNGPIPKGKRLVHKDGNMSNNALDNLYLEDI